jgi:hypothetical protein
LQSPVEVMVPMSGYLPFASGAEAWTKVAVMVELGPGLLTGDPGLLRGPTVVPIKVPVIFGTGKIVSSMEG